MQLDEVLEEAVDVVERVGAVFVAGELDVLPDLLVGRLGDLLELPLEASELAGDPGAAKQSEDFSRPRRFRR